MRNYVIIAEVVEGRCTPCKVLQHFNPEEEWGTSHLFRLLDADGKDLLYGLSKDPSSFEPQDDYDGICGCTSTEYFNTVFNTWEEL